MKIEIKEIKENPLMKRKEIFGIIEHDGMPTPSKAAVQKYLAKEQKVPEKHVDVRKIFSAVGRVDAKLIAYVWKEKEVPVLEEKQKPEEAEKEVVQTKIFKLSNADASKLKETLKKVL